MAHDRADAPAAGEDLTRHAILDALVAAYQPRPWALALWEGGSAAFGKDDAW